MRSETAEELAFLQESEDRLARSPDIARARTALVCCDGGRAIVYVGIEERGAATMGYRAEPEGDARLVLYANRDLPELRLVLRYSSDSAHRALAAQVLGYAADKPAVVEDLVHGMRDPSATVRNNASRALMVFAEMLPGTGPAVPRVPAEPFIELLGSPVWSDRNKASLALTALSAGRDPELLAALQERALAPLIEMARWKSEGHARPAFFILGRIAGYSDEATRELWERGDRDAVIDAARRRPRGASQGSSCRFGGDPGWPRPETGAGSREPAVV